MWGFPIAVATVASVATATATPTGQDLARAYLPKPLASSHVVGGDPQAIFAAMNKFMINQPYTTKACEAYTHEELNALARSLWEFRSEKLAGIYQQVHDNRQFHFDDFKYKEDLWAKESKMAQQDPATYGPGSAHHKMARDGKCAEMVMWWIHHLPEAARAKLSAVQGFVVPLLPAKGLVGKDLDHVSSEYVYQVSCSDCHSTGASSDATPTPDATPVPRAKGPVNGVPAGTCPLDGATGLPSVWYKPMSDVGNRKKRCDWDYDPPCGLCEGIGGWSWGDQENEISYTTCEPVALAKDIPVAERTSPVWPKAFVVEELTTLINQINTGGRFPGADPCAAHKFANDTETMYYDDLRGNFSGPVMFTKASATSIYTLPTADMFIDILGAFCICVSPRENGVGNKLTGPLKYDFAHDAVLIGREKIGLEGLDTTVVADHWNKGPHHFWISVETGRMVRGWQPWNGLNIYKPGTWRIGNVDKEMFDVPKQCYEGYLHRNISCVEPYPMAL